MGPPPRSFAADAHECIMVHALWLTEYKVAARMQRPTASSPRHRRPDQEQRAIVLAAVKIKPSAALTGRS
jgi:hypothetical protein